MMHSFDVAAQWRDSARWGQGCQSILTRLAVVLICSYTKPAHISQMQHLRAEQTCFSWARAPVQHALCFSATLCTRPRLTRQRWDFAPLDLSNRILFFPSASTICFWKVNSARRQVKRKGTFSLRLSILYHWNWAQKPRLHFPLFFVPELTKPALLPNTSPLRAGIISSWLCCSPQCVCFALKSLFFYVLRSILILNFKHRLGVKGVTTYTFPYAIGNNIQVCSTEDHDLLAVTPKHGWLNIVKRHLYKRGKQTRLISECFTWRHLLRGHRERAVPGATGGTTWHICSFPGSCLGCGTAGLGSKEHLWAALCSPPWQGKS